MVMDLHMDAKEHRTKICVYTSQESVVKDTGCLVS